MTDEQEPEPELAHAISIGVNEPTPEWLGQVTIRTTDESGATTVVRLCPHEAYMFGVSLVRYGSLLDGFNASLAAKPVEARKEIMELTAAMNMPDAEDPFDGAKVV